MVSLSAGVSVCVWKNEMSNFNLLSMETLILIFEFYFVSPTEAEVRHDDGK